MSHYDLETKCLHSGYTPKKGEPCALPIYQSTTFKYDTTDEMGQLFDLKAEGYFHYASSESYERCCSCQNC